MSIKGKVALVTGASSGIGEGIARKLAAHGAKLGLAARRVERLEKIRAEIEAAGGEAMTLEMDVTATEQVKAAVDRLVSAYGRVDVLVNNAGLMPASDLETLKVDEWFRMVDVNIKGVLSTTAAVLPHMIGQSSGHIVNISSIAGRKVFKGLAVYCATKHAVAALSEGMRMELSPTHNIRVTSIQPGAVVTELFEHITDAGYRAQMEDLKRQMTFLTPEDIAESTLHVLQAPPHVDVAEVFIMPSKQAW